MSDSSSQWNRIRLEASTVTSRWRECVRSRAHKHDLPVTPGLLHDVKHHILRPPELGEPDGDAKQLQMRRMLTWEDGLSTFSTVTPAFFPYWGSRINITNVLHMERGSRACEAAYCSMWPLPVAVRTHTRPNAAFVISLPNGRQYNIIDIPKVATSSITAVLHSSESQLMHYTQDKYSVDQRRRCLSRTYLNIVDEAVRLSRAGMSYAPVLHPCHGNCSLVSCGFAVTFSLDSKHKRRRCFARGCQPYGDTPLLNIALVRHPIGRFISALCPHNDVSYGKRELCKQIRQYGLGYARPTMSILDLLAWRARVMRFQVAHADDAHVRTQSYFLTSTDRFGKPIQWDAILRMEDSSFGQQLGNHFYNILTDAGEIHSDASRLSHLWSHRKHNSKSRDRTQQLMKEAEMHPTLLCDLCHIYGQDFACLGYEFPAQCAMLNCLSSMPDWLRRAILVNAAGVGS
mmetsp:Transcript_9505/g.28955  ORF Transcript_9505/g.28955 Transcript_9505/m.28955 type:complete len:458 (+) Transcript_9505:150-1523(+)